MDLILRNATLPDGRRGIDIAVDAAGSPTSRPASAPGGRGDRRRRPPCHAALRRRALPPGRHALPRASPASTIPGPSEGIALWGELKPLLTHEAVAERALPYCDWAVARGVLAIRSHVDVCDDRLLGVEALLDVRRRVAPYIDLQLVAFPQDGFYRSPNAKENLMRALDLGVEVVGGIPHFERTTRGGRPLGARALRDRGGAGAFGSTCTATRPTTRISRHIETLALETLRLGLGGRVAGSHLTSMHSMDNLYVERLIPLIRDAGVAAIANPLINITIQGRYDTYPKRRGMTRVPELLEAGIPVAFGQDCVLDPWYSLGSGDMLDVAHMGLHVAHMTSPEGIHQAFIAVTETPARIMGLEGYGPSPGCHGDFVLLDATSPAEAIRLRAARLAVVRRGKVVSRASSSRCELSLPWAARVGRLQVRPARAGSAAGCARPRARGIRGP